MKLIIVLIIAVVLYKHISASSAKRQERIAAIEKEQRRQAKILDKHEEQIIKLEQRLANAERELSFNRQQRDRLFALLDNEQSELDATVYGSKEWAKHQKKVISIENQINTTQKRIDKAQMEKYLIEKKQIA